MVRQHLVALTCSCIAIATTAAPTRAEPTEQFFQGKTVKIVVALGVGGDYDEYARLVSRWIAKQVPGNPSIVVQNMPGAGGLAAANYLYNVAPKDGTVIGALHANTTLAQLTEAPNVDYDVRRMGWIGRISTSGLKVHYAWNRTGLDTPQAFLSRQLVVGGGGATSESVVMPMVINQVMGGKLKILQGYSGTSETTLALERGEIDVAYQSWEILRRNNADWLRDNKINILVQYDVKRSAELPNVPTILEFAKTDDQKQVWSLFLASQTIGHSFVLPPGVPADRIAILRTAFHKMTADARLITDAEKVALQVEPLSGDNVTTTIKSLFDLSPATLAEAKRVLGR
jgi:tripartite-type tricarboxylate transporter receptor subunit TctC